MRRKVANPLSNPLAGLTATERMDLHERELVVLLAAMRSHHSANWHERAGELCLARTEGYIEWYCKINVSPTDLSRMVSCCWRPAGRTDGYVHLTVRVKAQAQVSMLARFVDECIERVGREVQPVPASGHAFASFAQSHDWRRAWADGRGIAASAWQAAEAA